MSRIGHLLAVSSVLWKITASYMRDKLYLIVANTNEKAGYVYEKVGFQTEGKLKEHFFVNGEYIDGIMMGVFQQDYWEMQQNKK
ncbi:Acetyltransferase (GNAT) domain-containing protein [Lentibacillus persicus]|uniref:Acetyltransferase (GNAT) domain-containing protein n=1 Tax=Lentibacillus persicus TaxID=640948 RepID=A0A1I2AHD0_9BACI|nr:Acetyltransferase (GNAT) domain-containing protein [Lentibacillus persicus]